MKTRALRHHKLRSSSSTEALDEFCACKQDMETIHVFSDASIDYFGVAELSLNDQKRIFHFASNRRFSVLYILVPIEARILRSDLEAGCSYIGAEFNIIEMLIISDFGSLLSSAIAGIPETNFVIISQQMDRFFDIMNIVSDE